MAPIVGAAVSRFELAFRRALFLLILLAVYLTFGTLLFWVLSHGSSANTQQTRARIGSQERLDFERTELLNVLWAESISRSEYDWSLLANQKLDAYEKSLLDAFRSGRSAGALLGAAGENSPTASIRTFAHAFRHAFLVITTIGGIDADALNSATKLFTILYALLGVPLVCLYLDQCVNAVAALLPGSESARSLNRAYFLAALVVIVGVSVAFDVIEQNDDDTPFLDVVFSVFLAASTIGAAAPAGGSVPLASSVVSARGTFAVALLFYVSCTLLIGTLRVALLNVQRRVERLIGNYEFEFTQKVGQLERVISGERLDNVQEDYREDEDSEIVDPATVPQINVNYNNGHTNGYNDSPSILVNRMSNPKRRSSDGERVHFKLNAEDEENEDAGREHAPPLNASGSDDEAVFTFRTVPEENEEADS